jgi:hypothetical protein
MGDVNEYKRILEPPIKLKKTNDGKQIDMICGQCNKLGHLQQRCQWNLENLNNKLKDKKMFLMNEIST